MTRQRIPSLGVLVVVGVVGLATAASADQAAGARPATGTAAKSAAGTGTPAAAVKKTPDGQPDITGVWLFFDNTPLETPGVPPRRRQGTSANEAPGAADAAQAAAAAARAARAAEAAAKAAAGGAAEAPAPRPDPEAGNAFYTDRGPVSAKRPSLVIEPANGHVPIKPEAAEALAKLQDRFYESYKFMNSAERCITRGVPGIMFPTQNAAATVVQGPGYVAFVYEMIHFARIIPIDNSPHLPKNVHFWTGDSRGHWEGNTLVVDTTNYNNEGTVTGNAGAGHIQGMRNTEALHVVERFTVADAKTINYEVTIEDPGIYSAPWKAALAMSRDDGSYKQFEYACHEGNKYMANTLRAGRVQDGTLKVEQSAERKAAEESVKGAK